MNFKKIIKEQIFKNTFNVILAVASIIIFNKIQDLRPLYFNDFEGYKLYAHNIYDSDRILGRFFDWPLNPAFIATFIIFVVSPIIIFYLVFGLDNKFKKCKPSKLRKIHLLLLIPAISIYVFVNMKDYNMTNREIEEYNRILNEASQVIEIDFNEFQTITSSSENYVLILKDADLIKVSEDEFKLMSASDRIDVVSFDITTVSNEEEQNVVDEYIKMLETNRLPAYILVIDGKVEACVYDDGLFHLSGQVRFYPNNKKSFLGASNLGIN